MESVVKISQIIDTSDIYVKFQWTSQAIM